MITRVATALIWFTVAVVVGLGIGTGIQAYLDHAFTLEIGSRQ